MTHLPFRRRTFLGGAAAAAAATALTIEPAFADAPTTFDVDDTDSAIYYSDVAHQTSFGDAWRPLSRGAAPGRHLGTAHVAQNPANKPPRWFSYTHASCTRIVWIASAGPDRGTSQVYVDGVLRYTANLYSAQLTHGIVAFDTGDLPTGSHTIKVVVSGSQSTELDRLRVTGDAAALRRISSDADDTMDFRGAWADAAVAGAIGGHTRTSDSWGNYIELAFLGSSIRWIGSTLPQGGMATVSIDEGPATTVDTYSAQAVRGVTLLSRSDLSAGPHVIRITVEGLKNPASIGSVITHEAFDCVKPASGALIDQMNAEIDQIRAGTKPYLAASSWSPVPYVAELPERGVTLTTSSQGFKGPLMTGFTNNIAYLTYCSSLSGYVEAPGNPWVANWPDANLGRMLRGAAQSLMWGENTQLRSIVTTVMTTIASTQKANGWALQIPENEFPDLAGPGERANYNRSMWQRGVVAALAAGDPKAPTVLRRFGDWFNSWVGNRIADPARPITLLECNHGIQAHIASTELYHSSVGVAADLEAAERYYVQDYWLSWLAGRHAVGVWRYPLSRPHSYLLTAFEALLDHYRATGAQKYLDAVLGGWEIFSRWFLFPGGGTAICEGYLHHYPGSYRINFGPNHISNEHCGTAFWVWLNARLLQLFPNEEKYANEIEKSLFNGSLAHQQRSGNYDIRYTGYLQNYKSGENGESLVVYSTCCEIQGTDLYGRLPSYVYAVSGDGLYVNLFESSTVSFSVAGADFGISTTTRFPHANSVVHTVTVSAPSAAKIRVRVPRWNTGQLQVSVNGSVVQSGNPGTYLVLSRTWTTGDTITYSLSPSARLTKYTGVDGVPEYDRYAIEYGPLLYGAVGSWDSTYRTDPSRGEDAENPGVPRINRDASELVPALTPSTTRALDLTIPGESLVLRPYWLIDGERFNCFPILERPNLAGAPNHSRRVNGAWSTFAQLPGVTTPNLQTARDAAIAPMPDGAAHIVSIGTDGTLYHRVRQANGGWAAPNSMTGLGPTPTTHCRRVAAAGGADAVAHFAVIGSDKAVYYQRREPSGQWTRFARVAPLTTAKDVAVALLPSLVLAVVDDDALVWTVAIKADGTWNAPVAVPGVGAGNQARARRVSATGSADGSLQIALIGTDGVVYHSTRGINGTWSTMASVNGAAGKDVALTTAGTGLALAIVGGDDYPYYQERTGSAWPGFGGFPPASGQTYLKARSVTAARFADGSTQVVVTAP